MILKNRERCYVISEHCLGINVTMSDELCFGFAQKNKQRPLQMT